MGIAAVDAIAMKSQAEEHGVQSFPTIILFKDGEYRGEYKG